MSSEEIAYLLNPLRKGSSLHMCRWERWRLQRWNKTFKVTQQRSSRVGIHSGLCESLQVPQIPWDVTLTKTDQKRRWHLCLLGYKLLGLNSSGLFWELPLLSRHCLGCSEYRPTPRKKGKMCVKSKEHKGGHGQDLQWETRVSGSPEGKEVGSDCPDDFG